MTGDRNFDRMAQAWLELGPNEAPDRAVSAVLQAVATTPQVRPLSRRLPWRYPTVNRLPIAAYVATAVVIVVVGGFLLSRSNGDSGAGGVVPSASATSPAQTASLAPSSSPSSAAPSATPGLFTSDRYGYSVTLPGDWLRKPATATWDGLGSPANDAPYVDQFNAIPRYSNVWAYAVPTNLTLAEYVTHVNETGAAEHPCSEGSQTPETDESITVGGEPARLLTIHCGILIFIATTIHNGSAAVFAFQDPNGNRTTDAEDRALFLNFLADIQFTS